MYANGRLTMGNPGAIEVTRTTTETEAQFAEKAREDLEMNLYRIRQTIEDAAAVATEPHPNFDSSRGEIAKMHLQTAENLPDFKVHYLRAAALAVRLNFEELDAAAEVESELKKARQRMSANAIMADPMLNAE